jgi:hypothetical protein
MQGETFFVDVNNDGYMDIVEVGRDVNNGWAILQICLLIT